MNFQILSIREVPKGFDAKVLALVTFSYVPDGFAGPLEVTRWSEKNEKEYVVAKVIGATGVMVHDAQLREGNEGRPWITTSPIRVPDEVRQAVAQAAHKRWLEMSAENVQFPNAPAAPGGAA